MKYSIPVRVALAMPLLVILPASAQNQQWIRQLGSGSTDSATASAADGVGGVYVSGLTFGSLGGPNAGGEDAWLARRDRAGNQIWIRQFGTSGYETALAAAPDAAGGVFLAGFTDSNLGGTSAGGSDAWIARYDLAGNQTWIRQLGTGVDETAWAAALDGSGGVFVCGDTFGNLGSVNAGANDAWIARYDSAGNQLWKRQFGTSNSDAAFAAAPDGTGGLFLAGGTEGSLSGGNAGSSDAWLARYDGAGTPLWVLQLGTGAVEFAQAAASDGAGGVYVSGSSEGSLGGPNAGGGDAWFARYDAAGNQGWIRQLGTSQGDHAAAAVLDGSGRAVFSGFTDGTLGAANAGGGDAWIASLDGGGNTTWIHQFGTNGLDSARALAPGAPSGVYVSGVTSGALGGPNAGGDDAWVARYSTTIFAAYCTSGTTTHGCVPSISASGTPSASAVSGFNVRVSSVEGQKLGLIFYGIDNNGFSPLPWGASTSALCVQPPVQRTTPQSSGGTLNLCDGVLAIDWNAYRAANPGALGTPFGVGQHVFLQGWFRDTPGPTPTALSDALEFVVQP